MTSGRVHPLSPPAPATYDSPESPLSSSSTASFIPKPSPPPGDYYIQVPKDHIYRLPPPENATLFASYTRRSKRSPRRRCCRLLCCLVAALVLLLAVAAGVLYLVFRPKIPSFSVDSLSVTAFNLSSAADLSPEIDATVRADNPNGKIGIFYRGGSDVSVFYNGLRLCSGSWPVFFQPSRNVTVFRSKLTGSAVTLSSSDRQSLTTAEAGGAVPLEIYVRVPVRIKFGAVTTWTITVKAECDVTLSDLKSNSKVVSQKCKVKVRV